MGPFVFLSSGDRNTRELLKLPQGCQGPFRGSRVKVGFLSRCRSVKVLHLTWRRESPDFFELWQETWGSSGVSTGASGLISCGDIQVCFPLQLEAQCQASCPVDIGIGSFLLRCDSAVTPTIMFCVDPQGDRRVNAGESDVS